MVNESNRNENKKNVFPIAVKMLSIFLTIFAIAILFHISMNIISYIYLFMHPQPKFGVDLGYGFVMLFWLIVELICAVIAFYPMYKFILGKIIKRLGENNG